MFLLGPAFGATLLYSGELPEELTRRLSAREGERLVPMTPSELGRGRDARLSEGGSALRCASAPASTERLEQAIAQAEEALAYMEFGQAAARLATAADLLACLQDPVDQMLAARLFFLQGVVAQRAGSDLMAEQAFQRALFFVPDLAWDEAQTPKARPLFEAVQSSSGGSPVWLRVVGGDALLLDGRAVTLQDGGLPLQPGTHLVQADGVTITVTVLEGEAPVLVLPASVQDAAVSWVGDEVGRDALARLFEHAGEESAWVLSEGTLWSWSERTWTYAGHADEVLPPRGSRSLLVTGGVVAAAGGGTALAGYAQARQGSQQAAAASTFAEFQPQRAAYDTGVTIMRVGEVVAVAGVALAAGGAVVYLEPAAGTHVALTPASLTVRW